MVLSAKVKKASKVLDMPVKRTIPNRKRMKFRLNGPSVILLIILGFVFYSFGGQMVEMYNVEHEIKDIKVQMDEFRTKNADLRKQVEQLNSDAFIKREAREKLGLVKPGEKIILEAKPGAKLSNTPNTSKKSDNKEVH